MNYRGRQYDLERRLSRDLRLSETAEGERETASGSNGSNGYHSRLESLTRTNSFRHNSGNNESSNGYKELSTATPNDNDLEEDWAVSRSAR